MDAAYAKEAGGWSGCVINMEGAAELSLLMFCGALGTYDPALTGADTSFNSMSSRTDDLAAKRLRAKNNEQAREIADLTKKLSDLERTAAQLRVEKESASQADPSKVSRHTSFGLSSARASTPMSLRLKTAF